MPDLGFIPPSSDISLPIDQSDVTDLETDLAAKQPLDADRTAIAALSHSNDDFLQAKSGAWANRTIAQVKADLGLVPFVGPRVSLKSGYYSGRYLNQATGTGTFTNNAIRAVPLFIQGSATIDRIAAEVTTARESGSKVRLGIYADDGTGYYGVVGGLLVPLSAQSGSITTTNVAYSQASVSGALPEPFAHTAFSTTEIKLQVRAA